MEIIRDYQTELVDRATLHKERLIIRAIAGGIITQAGGVELLHEVRR